jgi:pimeloyl-ACP methyl ester carboxylesterase
VAAARAYPRVSRAIMRNLSGLIQARARYTRVEVPVTLVYSQQDWSRPAERDHVAGLLADLQRITLPDAGHFSALGRPADVGRILLQQRS